MVVSLGVELNPSRVDTSPAALLKSLPGSFEKCLQPGGIHPNLEAGRESRDFKELPFVTRASAPAGATGQGGDLLTLQGSR